MKANTDEEFSKAMRGEAYELFSEFEEDNVSVFSVFLTFFGNFFFVTH